MILLGYSVLLLFWTCCSAQNECKTPPPRRRKEVLTETWNKASYPHGTRATYVCRPGYIKLGRVIFQCNNGIWEHAPPYTECQNKPCGHPGDIPFGSFDLTEGNEFVFGARVEYKCNDGYRMLSQRHVRECLADGWSNDLPHCEVIKCLPITAPEHGRIVMSGSYETDQEFSFGQAIRFECNEDYKLKGDREIYCSATGDWSQEVPQCIEITCTPPIILNGGVMVPRRLYKENERIQFNCDIGFKFNERSDAVCTEDGWRPAPLCIEVTCDPPKVADGSFVPSKTIYREEDVITVDCKRGFHFDSFSGNTAQCTKNGWIPVPKCVLRPCDYPQVENIELSGYYQSNREQAFPAKIGSSTYYRCANGYVTATEENWVLIRCTRDGWDPAPKCIKLCSVPDLENGGTSYWHWKKFKEGETISYSCHRGYIPENQQDRIMCAKDGWSPTPRCISELTCPVDNLENGRFHLSFGKTYHLNDRITYSCNSENDRENQQRTVTCTKNGWWPTPRCIPGNICKKVEIIHGYFTEKKDIFNLNDETTYRCVIGYTTPDGNETGNIRCIRTGWSPSPGCSKTCTRPNLENILLKTSKKVFSPGDGLTYECADGYQTIHKSTSGYTTCSKNGWTPEPQCLAIECEMLTLAKGTISPQEGKYRNGDVITFSCAKSYTRVGPDSAQCYYFGWSPAPPLCKEKVRFCEQPQAVLNASIISEIQELYEHGTIMEYQCNFRFKMIGSSKIECIDGKWSPSPSCTEEVKICGPPRVIPNGSSLHTNQTEYFHGDSVAYGCETNFEIWGTGEAKCLSGEWTHLPLCADKSAQCAVPKSSEAIYLMPYKPSSAEKINFGTVLKYKCKTDVKNTKESTCVSGKWLPEIECKPKEIKKQCPPPPQVPGALKVTETRNYESGEEIAFQCLENFEASPSTDKILCEDGKWQSPPRCVEINACGLPPPLENGKLRQEHQNLGVEQSGPVTYPNGFVLEYTCHTGFVLKGRSKITCSMGTWTEGPTCDEMPCGKVPSVLHSVQRRGTKIHYKAGETVRYECRRGFSIRGEENIICQAGNWTKPPTCEDVSCGPPPQVANADFVSSRPQKPPPGTKVQYRCRSHFQLVGSNEVTCENRQWSQAPICQDVRCGPPPNVANADIIPTDNEMYPPGTRVQYKCHRGFRSVGSNQVICENREWSQPPTCQDATCGSPPAIVDGWIADTKRERYFPGEIIRYRCQHGQTLTGPARIVCKEGNWSPPGTPECNEAAGRCGPPPTIENGDTTTFPLLYYERDAVVTYKCKNLYIMKGSQYATCNSGQWTEPPTCIEPCTASEEDMAENNIRLKWASGEKLYSPSGDVIEFECIPGYVRDPASPSFRVQCQEGKLPYPRCKLRGTSG
ncbi:complement factor H isoform X2 [Alligator mississippiensis]|uniref:complement factor H isoform X2 n=1 Tax=Alligator mississippiensis TaxID=8496 RepID=UPI0028772758|nr:complement factor H isoform X2 [Alligator mississippiensis]